MPHAMDLLLLHPPSVYDFRKRATLYGPVSDMVPSSVMFEIYPIGFLTLANYLEVRGRRVRIANLALRMIQSRRFDVPRFLRDQRPKLIGIDLHWMPHCHGAIEIARIAKQVHPDVPIVFGGLSSSYFHKELLAYPEVDFVLRGDSTEEPTMQLLDAIERGEGFGDVPNLSWRDADGERHTNAITYLPSCLDHADVRPDLLIDMALRYRDLASVLPFDGWLRNPTTMVLPLKGCAFECTTCGSSATTCTHVTTRKKPVFRSPENLADNVEAIAKLSRGAIVMPGDLLQGGRAYFEDAVDAIAARGVTNDVMFEFFDLPPVDALAYIDERLPTWSFELSPESHDPKVRFAMEGGGGYANEAMEALLASALELRPTRIDVFFMIGLQYQTYTSVMETVDYCERLFALGDRRLQAFISPMGPFLDPGSHIFENPEAYGFTRLATTLEEHRQQLLAPSWEEVLNYETQWMTRRELVDATYDAAERLNDAKRRYGYLSPRRADAVARHIHDARTLRTRLDAVTREEGASLGEDEALRGDVFRFSHSTVSDKRELFWRRPAFAFKTGAVLQAAWRNVSGRRPGQA